jgi:flagellar assembly protein FliH
MVTAEKFLFNESFDEPVAPPQPEPVEEELPPAPTFSEEELAAAREEAYRAGVQAGQEEARQGIEQSCADTLDSIGMALGEMISGIDRKAQEIECASLKAAVDVARRLVPSLATSQAQVEIETIIGECLERLHEEPRIVVRVADTAIDTVKSRLDELAESKGFEGRIVLLSQPDFQPSEVKVEWADGGAERNLAAIWADVDAALARALEAMPAAGPAPGSADQPTNDSPSMSAESSGVQK